MCSQSRCSQLFETANLALDVIYQQVEMHSVLDGLGLIDLLKGESDIVATPGDEAALDDPVHDESRGVHPEPRQAVQVRAVEGELDPHTAILSQRDVTRPRNSGSALREARGNAPLCPLGAIYFFDADVGAKRNSTTSPSVIT